MGLNRVLCAQRLTNLPYQAQVSPSDSFLRIDPSTCLRANYPLIGTNYLSISQADGKNDRLFFQNLEFYTPCHLTLFNRWGAKVLDIANYQNQAYPELKQLTPGHTYYLQLLGSHGALYKGWLMVE